VNTDPTEFPDLVPWPDPQELPAVPRLAVEALPFEELSPNVTPQPLPPVMSSDGQTQLAEANPYPSTLPLGTHREPSPVKIRVTPGEGGGPVRSYSLQRRPQGATNDSDLADAVLPASLTEFTDSID
jgi:hypothetical protein